MAKNVDPDQTAGSARFAYAILSETLVFKVLGHNIYCIWTSCRLGKDLRPKLLHILLKVDTRLSHTPHSMSSHFGPNMQIMISCNKQQMSCC